MFNLIKRVINQDNYDSIANLRIKLLAYRSAVPPMITEEEYDILSNMLDKKENPTINQ